MSFISRYLGWAVWGAAQHSLGFDNGDQPDEGEIEKIQI
jgi:hypothetical protein